jgi:hypothetical protein
MAVTESRIHDQKTGNHKDATQVTQSGALKAHRQAVVIADPETLAARQKNNQRCPGFGRLWCRNPPIGRRGSKQDIDDIV